ncbi:MAG: ABC transporter permease [Lachnospiraceae bacterium]|nr:ABC transporter permease [Lachnospiraceae bacterium]
MKKMIEQIRQVFSFSFHRHVEMKGYRTLTVVGMILCLLVPAVIMGLIAWGSEQEQEPTQVETIPIRQVVVVDTTEPKVDYSLMNEMAAQMSGISGMIEEGELNEALESTGLTSEMEEAAWLIESLGNAEFANLEYVTANDMEEAKLLCADKTDSVILYVTEAGNGALSAYVLLPDDSSILWETAWAYQDFLSTALSTIQGQKANLTTLQSLGVMKAMVKLVAESGLGEQMGINLDPSMINIPGSVPGGAEETTEPGAEGVIGPLGEENGASREDDMEPAGEQEGLAAEEPTPEEEGMPSWLEEEQGEDGIIKLLLSFVLPYITIMLLYFMILFYGQGIAQSLILEKTSKLVDQVLLTIHPTSMVLGKLLAICAAGLMQLLLWLVSLAIGFGGGAFIAGRISPQMGEDLAVIWNNVIRASGMFTPGGVILALLILFAGFILYGSLAALGGAMASKPEDLNNTNVIFTMCLVVSMMACMFGGLLGSLDTGFDSSMWQLYVPFTAAMMSPSAVLLGQMSIGQGLLVLAIIIASVVLFCVIAGRIYRALLYYRGKPLSPIKVVQSVLKK